MSCLSFSCVWGLWLPETLCFSCQIWSCLKADLLCSVFQGLFIRQQLEFACSQASVCTDNTESITTNYRGYCLPGTSSWLLYSPSIKLFRWALWWHHVSRDLLYNLLKCELVETDIFRILFVVASSFSTQIYTCGSMVYTCASTQHVNTIQQGKSKVCGSSIYTIMISIDIIVIKEFVSSNVLEYSISHFNFRILLFSSCPLVWFIHIQNGLVPFI